MSTVNKDSKGWCFDNSFSKLPAVFFSDVLPQTSPEPSLVVYNQPLAEELGVHFEKDNPEKIAQLLSGNELLIGSHPIAQAYAGHQFGYFNMLGDGRAILLGEHITPAKNRIDIQLKGSGPTVYSRRGDGQATLSSMLREYLISEAMFGLRIPTTRSLAVVKTGRQVVREDLHQGAVLTRIATSHIRVGNFEYAKNFLDKEQLSQLFSYVYKRHPPISERHDHPVLNFFDTIIDKQVALITNWLRVGFIHGVMNTDNMSISGETIDYGPCAFMNQYDPATVFSYIDTNGRYAFGNQPSIAHWNLACLADSLLPLISDDVGTAMALITPLLDKVPARFEKRWQEMICAKIGLEHPDQTDLKMAMQLLEWMKKNQADFTNTFRFMMGDDVPEYTKYEDESFSDWFKKWKRHIEMNKSGHTNAMLLMQQYNPAYIPRNHLVESALEQATTKNDMRLFNDLLKRVCAPYHSIKTDKVWMSPPPDGDVGYHTFCGT
jgi:uncharacterized protein YdiU (UPF0061 family)